MPGHNELFELNQAADRLAGGSVLHLAALGASPQPNTTFPSGFVRGAILINTTATAKGSTIYCNIGSLTASDWTAFTLV